MTDWFEWRGENFYAVRGEDLYYCGYVWKRMGVERWDAWARGEHVGVFVSEAAARRRVELVVTGRCPVTRIRSALRDGQPPPALPDAVPLGPGYIPTWKFK